MLVTHEPRVAAYSDREVVVRDGRTRDGGRARERWLRELGLGARLALAGGREGWLRRCSPRSASRSASALLLVAASVPDRARRARPRRARDDHASSTRGPPALAGARC